jgi:hypothetical protein
MKLESLGMISFILLIEDKAGLESLKHIARFAKINSLSHEVIATISNGSHLGKQQIEKAIANIDNTTILISEANSNDALYSLGLEQALGDTLIEIPHSLHVLNVLEFLSREDSKLNFEKIIKVEGRGDFAIQLLPENLGKIDRMLSWIASKTLEIDTSTMSLYPRISSRSALTNWNSRRLRHKVVRLAPQLNFVPVQAIVDFDIQKLKSDLEVSVGMRTIVHSTPKPLRWVSLISLSGSGLSLLYSIFVLFLGTTSSTARGWTTTSLQLSGLSFLILLVLGLLSEYIFQIVASTIAQPSYFIVREYTSRRFTFSTKENVEAEANEKYGI